MQDLGLLQYNFQVFLTIAVFLRPVTPIFFRSFSTSSIHLFLCFPTAHSHSGTSYFYVYIFPSALYSHNTLKLYTITNSLINQISQIKYY